MKKASIVIIIILLILCLLLYYSNTRDNIDVDYIQEVVRIVSSYPRGINNKEIEHVRNYVIEELEKNDLNVMKQEFICNDSNYTGINIIAEKKIKKKNDKILIIGAHYDAVADLPGANDNAVGVGVLLEVAKYVSDLKTDMDIRLVAFDAEEIGLVGSNYYIESLGEEIDKVIGMINFDYFASKNATKVNTYIGEKSENYLFNKLKNVEKYKNIEPSDFMGWSDYKCFLEKDIPILFLGHPIIESEYNTGNDVAENISEEHLLYVAEAVITLIDEVIKDE